MVTTKNGSGEENASEERQLYASISPRPREVNKLQTVLVSFEELQRIFPERVLLSRIDDIFRAWMAAEARLPPEDRVRFDASLLVDLFAIHGGFLQCRFALFKCGRIMLIIVTKKRLV